MFAQQLSRALSARGIHYAWFVAALTFLFSLAASTALTVPGVLMIPMSQEFGWNLGDISSAMALRLFLFGAIAPFAGALMVRYGLIRIMSISATLVVLGVLLAAMMTQKWQLWLSVGVILGIAPGMTALVVSAPVRDHVAAFLAVGAREIPVERDGRVDLRKPKVIAAGCLCDHALDAVELGGRWAEGRWRDRFPLRPPKSPRQSAPAQSQGPRAR